MTINQNGSVNGSLETSMGLERAAYVPPHLRARAANDSTPYVFCSNACSTRADVLTRSNGWSDSGSANSRPRSDNFGGHRSSGGSSWAPRGGSASGGRSANSTWGSNPSHGSGGGGGGGRRNDGYGYWKDGKHVIASRNPTMERELYGDADDPLKQHTGINFDKYEDIPVEATGAGVPEPVNQFTNPPLDPVTLFLSSPLAAT
ncbi:hypothetical protein AG1IA_02559 [Rhizoctonia solani AG-1 IA]|uniref:Uncharacterized protein n=1 Tax=Thanatephorus cucumeris (strain AG1-IA) TaxID=983506 RepID=L8WZK0_THACA|nr:hypothetical protein AG1IA_02559 [Rhizoctonia solani AG-1 IA]